MLKAISYNFGYLWSCCIIDHFFIPTIPVPEFKNDFSLSLSLSSRVSLGHCEPISVQLNPWWYGDTERLIKRTGEVMRKLLWKKRSWVYVHNDFHWQLSLIQHKPPPSHHPLHFPPSIPIICTILHPTIASSSFNLFRLSLSATSSVVSLSVFAEWLQEWQIYLLFLSSTRMLMHTNSPPSLATWADTEWLVNEACSVGVGDLTEAGMRRMAREGVCIEKTKREREAGIIAIWRKDYSPPFHDSSPFICHLLCVPCQQLECCMDTGEQKGEVAERENV